MSAITVFSQPGCGPCISVKTHLKRAGVGFEVRDITKDDEAAETVRQLGYLGTPVTVAGDMHAYGYRRDWLDRVVAAVRAEDVDAGVDGMLAAVEETAA